MSETNTRQNTRPRCLTAERSEPERADEGSGYACAILSLIIRYIALSLTVEVALANSLFFVVTVFTFAKSEFYFKIPSLKIRFKRNESITFFADFSYKPRNFAFMKQ